MPYTGRDKKATNFGSKIFNGTRKFPYKFKEKKLHSSVRQERNNNIIIINLLN